MPVVAKQGRLVLRPRTAAELMSPNPMSIRAEATVAEAVAVLTDRGYCAAPVIDEAGHPIGVVSRSDLMVHQREHDRHPAGKPDYFFSPGAEPADALPEGKTGKSTVADLMTPAVFAVSPETPVDRVVSDMVGLHVHRLFVVDDDGILVGVISTMDVLKHLRAEE